MQTLDDYLNNAEWAATLEAQAKRAVFERFYGVAIQQVESGGKGGTGRDSSAEVQRADQDPPNEPG